MCVVKLFKVCSGNNQTKHVIVHTNAKHKPLQITTLLWH